MSVKVTPLTTEEAIERIKVDYPRDGNVVAANYDGDCPNYEEHDEDGTCHCWDGLTMDDVMTWVENGVMNVEGFAEWGPFALWEEVEDDFPLDDRLPEHPSHAESDR